MKTPNLLYINSYNKKNLKFSQLIFSYYRCINKNSSSKKYLGESEYHLHQKKLFTSYEQYNHSQEYIHHGQGNNI